MSVHHRGGAIVSTRYLVRLDLERLGRHPIVRGANLTEAELRAWLRRCGFEEMPADAWACTLECLQTLEPEAIVGLQSADAIR
jgi:hypothetical protein